MKLSERFFWRPIASGLRAAGLIGRPTDMEVLRSMQRARLDSSGNTIPGTGGGGFRAGDSDRLTGKWGQAPLPIDAVLRDKLSVVRARAREASLNSDWDYKFDTMVRGNIVGPDGIRPQVNLLTKDGDPDRLINDAVEKAWKKYGQAEFCDVAEQETFLSLQNSVISTVRRDGEAIIRKYVGPDQGPFAVRHQLIDCELLDMKLFEDLPNGNKIRFGIEFTKLGKPVNYYFLDETTLNSAFYGYGYSMRETGDHVVVPADEILHLFVRRFVGQKRGIPWTANALFRLKMLDGYEEAAVVAARVGASKMGFFRKDDSRGMPLEKNADGSKRMSAAPGQFDELPANTHLESWDPNYPHEQFESFVRAQLRGVASGFGVSYPMLANDLSSVNFSSIRASVLEDRDVWKAGHRFMIDGMIRPCFRGWLFFALATGKVVDESGGVIGPDRFEAIMDATNFVARGWAWVDPMKEAKAAAETIASFTGTRSQYIRDQGRDPSEVFAERAREDADLRRLGLDPTASPIPREVVEVDADDEK